MSFLVFILLNSISSWAVPKDSKVDEAVRELSVPMTEDRVFYRWQSTKSGENLHREGKMTRELNKYFMNLQYDIAAGPGIYMAGKPQSSSSYLPKAGGNLLEIRIAKGTRILDVTDATVARKLKDFGLNPDKLTKAKISEPILILYSSDWYVGKNLVGKANFELFPGKAQDAQAVKKVYNNLDVDRRAQEQAYEQLVTLRRDLVEEIVKDPKLGDTIAARYMSVDQVAELIRRELPSDRASITSELSATLLAMPDKGRGLLKDAKLAENLKRKMLDNAMGYEFARVSAHMPEDWAAEYLLKANYPESFFQSYLREIRELPSNEFANKIKALNTFLRARGREGFTEDVRTFLAHEIMERTTRARLKKMSLGDMADLATEEFLNAPAVDGVRTRVLKSKEFVTNYELLKSKPTFENVSVALREVESYEELERLVDDVKLKKVSVLRQILNQDSTHYSRHLDKIPTPVNLVGLTRRLENIGVNVASLNIERISKLPQNRRDLYLAECIDWSGCRKMLKGNWSKLIQGMDDLSFLAATIKRMKDKPSVREFETEIFQAIRTPQQMRTFTLLKDTPIRSAEILAKINEIGFNKFRPQEVLKTLDLKKLGAAERKGLLLRSIDSAVSPADVNYVKTLLVEEKLESTELGRVLERKMQGLKPAPNDIETYNKIGQRKLPQTPAPEFDCLRHWARTL